MYLMRSSKGRGFVSPISCPLGFMVIMACQDDHQKMKGFLTGHDSWDFDPHLMCSVSVTHIMATWHVLINGVNAPFV